jgi:hypothetical protein
MTRLRIRVAERLKGAQVRGTRRRLRWLLQDKLPLLLDLWMCELRIASDIKGARGRSA